VSTLLETPDFDEFRQYFGEKITLLFMFQYHYKNWLSLPIILGVPCNIVMLAQNDFNFQGLPLLAFIVSIWAVCMTEYWKRKESTAALRYGTSEYENQLQDRPDFVGEIRQSPINGEKEIYFPEKKRALRKGLSSTVVFLIASCAVAVVVGIYAMKAALRNDIGDSVQTLASILSAIQIQFFDFIFNKWLVYILTNFENHQTNIEYEDSIIGKLFIFQFVNSYSSFFYLAFVAEYMPVPDGAPDNAVGECGAPSCMPALAQNVAIIFFSRLASNVFAKVGMPILMEKLQWCWGNVEIAGLKEKNEKKKRSSPEKQADLLRYDPMLYNIQSFQEIAIQFGYLALFLVALPAAPLFAYISCAFDIRASIWQLCNVYQRPDPDGGSDIGTWQMIFQLMAGAAVITNAGLMVFTMDIFDEFDTSTRFFLFIGFQWLVVAIMALLAIAIPDVPEEVVVQHERTKFLYSRVLEKEAGDTEVNKQKYKAPMVEIDEFPF